MTDGILLAETQGDPELRAYDTIILDEAHERSLNIDFLMGYLKRLLPRRPDLKVVITSATIDAERFSKHFGDAPVVEVSGRLYPVEVRYRPVGGDEEDTTRDEEEDALGDAVEELFREGSGDVLVFLPGEREIRDAAAILGKRNLKGAEILPLFGRLSAAEQDRVFHRRRRKARGARDQRGGNVAHRAAHPLRRRHRPGANQAVLLPQQGRDAARGEDLPGGRAAARRPLRARRERHVHPPVRRGRVQGAHRLHRPGGAALLARRRDPAHEVAQPRRGGGLPLPRRPRLARDLGRLRPARGTRRRGRREPADGHRASSSRGSRSTRASRACSSRRRPKAASSRCSSSRRRSRCRTRASGRWSKQAAADERQAKFDDERSDFLAYLKLWKLQGSEGLRRTCRDNFLSYPRMREWRDVHAQLITVVGELDWKMSSAKMDKPDGYRAVHRALLAGLLGNLGMQDIEHAYTGARGIKFRVHPGSGDEEAGQVDRRRRAGGNHAPLRAHRGDDRRAVARGARRAPAQAPPRQPALGEGPRAGGRDRARHALWHCRSTPSGACTTARTTWCSRATSSCARRWSKASSTRARPSSRTTASSSPTSSAWSTSSAAPTSWSTTS